MWHVGGEEKCMQYFGGKCEGKRAFGRFVQC